MPHNSSADFDNASDIRQLKRAQRRLLPGKTQKQHSVDLCQHLKRLRVYQNCQHVALYLANDGEIDPAPIIEHAWQHKKSVYLPILAPLKNSLYFAPYRQDSRLVTNRFGIEEPETDPAKWKKAAQLDLLLLPLVAFDPQGNRIGMGGGFYDRTLAYRQHRRHWHRPRLIGLAHEIQKVSSLDRQHWDIPLDHVLTERQIYDVQPYDDRNN